MNAMAPTKTLRLVVIAILCFVAGGATVYVVLNRRPPSAAPTSVPAPPPAVVATPSSERMPDLVVPIPADLASRAGIELVRVGHADVRSTLRVPGTVTPNQYQQTQVSSVVGGRVTSVTAQLGDRVRRGAPLAQIFSSELADAQTRYLAARAELSAVDERLRRTTRLVSIGAASQQELEQTQAERTKAATEVEGMASRLRLFGMSTASVGRLKSAADVASSITITAPSDGVVTERTANAGLVVMPSVPLLVISSLSPVWVIADIAERDVARVTVGMTTRVTVEGATTVPGKVVYISPDVRPETRTVQVRVETPNPTGQLRFGMLVTVELDGAKTSGGLSVPETAIQSIGDRSFVYVGKDGSPGAFIEREVTLGARSNGAVEITHGLTEGERVVSKGSFFVRAERERLGLRAQTPSASTTPRRVVSIAVTAAGFEPPRVEVAAGTHVTLQFTRKVKETCATAVAVRGRKGTTELPLDTPVDIDLGTVPSGEIGFACGMDMLKGTVVVR
jgi:membrane fusion protein, heavy metal efflux system